MIMGQSSQPLDNNLSANAKDFIQHFDSCYEKIQHYLLACQLQSKRLEQLRCFILGYVTGVLSLIIFVFIAAVIAIQNEPDLQMHFRVFALSVVAIVIYLIRSTYVSSVNKVNLNIRDFRKSVFGLIIELGKLKQRCEDLRGVEQDNLQRLEESIDELLFAMKTLTETVTRETMDEVQKEYVNIFNQLEKMKARLSFYTELSEKATS